MHALSKKSLWFFHNHLKPVEREKTFGKSWNWTRVFLFPPHHCTTVPMEGMKSEWSKVNLRIGREDFFSQLLSQAGLFILSATYGDARIFLPP